MIDGPQFLKCFNKDGSASSSDLTSLALKVRVAIPTLHARHFNVKGLWNWCKYFETEFKHEKMRRIALKSLT